MERPITDELDISGWDLNKAFGLLRKSNPALMEWGAIAYCLSSVLAPRRCFSSAGSAIFPAISVVSPLPVDCEPLADGSFDDE